MYINQNLLFEILDNLRNNFIFVLMGSEFEDELHQEGVKLYKWHGFEKEQAEQSSKLYIKLIKEMSPPIAEELE